MKVRNWFFCSFVFFWRGEKEEKDQGKAFSPPLVSLSGIFLSTSLSSISNSSGHPALVRRDPAQLFPLHHRGGLPAAAPEEARRGRGSLAAADADAAGDGREHAAPDRRGRDRGPAAHRRLLVEGAHEQAEEEGRGAQGVFGFVLLLRVIFGRREKENR